MLTEQSYYETSIRTSKLSDHHMFTTDLDSLLFSIGFHIQPDILES